MRPAARCTMSIRRLVTSGVNATLHEDRAAVGGHLREDVTQLRFAGQVQLRVFVVEVVVRQQVLPPPAVGDHDGKGQ